MKMEYKNILPYFSNITQYLTESRKIILLISAIMFLAFYIMLPTTNTSAESFQSSQSVSFTFNPTVSITVSGDLVIESLTPGDYKDSNIITVTATSNAVSGYTLSGTVGNSTHSSPSFDNTNLNHTNGTNTFTNLSTNKASLSAFDENSNTWGYSWCSGTCTASTETTSWVSGNVGSTTQGYNGLPIYTTDSPIQFINSTSSDSSTISFKIGARSTATQIAGEYTNVINFIGVANPNPPIVYMQSATMADCGKTMVDIRDNNVYATALLADNKCWLLDNLRLDPTDPTTAMNMNESNTNATNEAINNYLHGSQTAPESGWSTEKVTNFIPTGAEGETFNTYTEPVINNQYAYTTTTSYGRGSGLTGIYYNYCAATAGTYCYASGQGVGNAGYDVCPANWRMPTGGPDGEYQNLCDTLYDDICPSRTYMNATDISSLQYNLSTTLSGYYDGSHRLVGFGGFWSSTRYNDGRIYLLYVDLSNVYPQITIYGRDDGLPMRCVMND